MFFDPGQALLEGVGDGSDDEIFQAIDPAAEGLNIFFSGKTFEILLSGKGFEVVFGGKGFSVRFGDKILT